MARSETCDIIVIGGGSAAFEAAVAARKAGAERVVMLEKAPEAEYGGNARYSGTGFRFVHAGARRRCASSFLMSMMRCLPPCRSRLHAPTISLADLDRMTQGRMNRDARRAAGRPNPTRPCTGCARSASLGAAKEHAEVDGKRYFERGIAIHVDGGGLGQLQQWRRIATERGVEIRFGSPVCAVIGDVRRGRGRRVSSAEGRYDLDAKAIIACSGGFQANAGDARALSRRRYRPDEGARQPPRHRRGSARCCSSSACGRRATGNRATCRRSTPTRRTSRPRSDAGRPWQYPEPLRLSVRHQRQCARPALLRRRRGAAFLHLRQDRTRGAAQPGGVAYPDLRSERHRMLPATRDYPATIRGGRRRIAELAGKIGVEPERALAHGRGVQPRLSTTTGLRPPRQARRQGHQARHAEVELGAPHDQPPFRAYPVTGGITFTFGGVAGEPAGAGDQHASTSRSKASMHRRYRRTVLSQLSVIHRTDPQRRFQPLAGKAAVEENSGWAASTERLPRSWPGLFRHVAPCLASGERGNAPVARPHMYAEEFAGSP